MYRLDKFRYAWKLRANKCPRLSHAKDFILVVLLCGWLVQGPLAGSQKWELIEFFSGKGRISRLASKVGLPTASLEILLDKDDPRKGNRKRNQHFPQRSHMDFCGHVGFALLVSQSSLLNAVSCLHDM